MQRLVIWLLVLVTLGLLAAQFGSSLKGPADVDEFGNLQQGRIFLDAGGEKIASYKAGMTLIAATALQIGDREVVGSFMAGRLFAFFFKLAFLLAIFMLTREQFGLEAAGFAVLLATANFYMVDQGFRFRPELLNAGLFSFAWYLLLRQTPRAELGAAVLMLAALAVHDKAAYLLAPTLFFIRPTRNAWLRVMGPIAAVATLGAGYVFWVQDANPFSLIIHRLTRQTDNNVFVFGYLQAVARSPFFLFLWGVGLAFCARSSRYRVWVGAAVMTIVFLIIHPAPFPFFFLLALPAFVPVAALGAWKLVSTAPNSQMRVVWVAFICLAIAHPSLRRLNDQKALWSQFDLTVADHVEAYLEAGFEGYFDGVGMVVGRAQTYHVFLDDIVAGGLREAGRVDAVIEQLEKRRTQVITKTTFANGLGPQYEAWLDAHFVQDWGPIFVSGRFLSEPPVGKQVVTLDYAGYYAIDPPNIARVNGLPVRDACCLWLEAGEHEVDVISAAAYLRFRLRPSLAPGIGHDWLKPSEMSVPFLSSWKFQFDSRQHNQLVR